MSVPDPAAIEPLLKWLREFAPTTKSPTPENGDTVYTNLTELTMWLGEMEDAMKVETRILWLKAAGVEHNADVKARCERRRAEAVPCGGTTTTKCTDCPKKRGLYMAIRSQA